MVWVKSKHSFATQRLRESKFKFYNDNKQILRYRWTEYPRWEIPPVETKLQMGVPLFIGTTNITQKITEYSDLLFYGVMISKRRPRIQRFPGQKREYFLTRVSSSKPEVGEIPLDHKVEINSRTGEIRLIGRGSMENWFQPKPETAGQFQPRKSLFDNRGYSYSATVKKYLPMDSDEEPEFTQIIPEIAVGITDDGKLLCIQEERENPTIGILGHKRHGKSLFKHRLMDCVYHKWKKKVIELNDVLKETDSYSLSWQKPLTKFSNLDLINEPTIPLPMVYLHPKTRTLKSLIGQGEVGFETYISFKDFISDFNNILKGREDWKFSKSGVYFRNLLYDDEGNLNPNGLAFCTNYKQIQKVVYDNMLVKSEEKGFSEEEKQKKIPEGVIPKILGVLKDIDNAKILDVSNGAKAKWTVEFPDGHKEDHYPWIACIIADLVPSIVTNNIKNNHPDLHPQISNFILNDLFKNQNDNDYFRDNYIELFIFFDEILALVNSVVAVDTFKTVIRESGPSRIGFTYCSQAWGEVPEFIQSQTDYIVSFKQKADWAKDICKDFGALKHRQKDLINLKKGQFILFSANPIILYDKYGKKEEIEGEAIKATVFSPLSAHKAPKKIGK